MIKLGIVGFGIRSSLAAYADDPASGSRVTWVCDTAERGRADAAAKLPEARITADLDELLNADVDGVLILTPDHLHTGPAVAALRAGKAVFCEKPLATTIDGCDEILGAAFETRSRLFVGHNMRYMPVITAMRELITAGRIGEVQAIWCRHFVGNGGDFYFKDWHADRRNSTGLLLQKGAHDIDVIHWLAGGYSATVAAMGALKIYGDIADRRDRSGERMWDWFSLDNWPPRAQTGLNPVVDVEDISMMNMTLDNGVLASYQQCHFTPDYWRNYTVIGSEGRLENLSDEAGARIAVWDRRSMGPAEPNEVVRPAAAAGGHGGADPLLIRQFVRFAAEGGDTDTSPVAARQAVAAGVTATESLRSGGGALPVPALSEGVRNWFEVDRQAAR